MTGIETTLVLQIAGTAISALGALSQGQAAQDAANYNASVAFNNAHAARLAANEDAKRQKRLAAKRQGTLRAIDPNKLDLLEDSAIEEELAIASIVHAGEVQAVGFENNARLEIARGKAARKSGFFSAASTVLMGGAAAASGFGGGGTTSATTPGMSTFGPPTRAQYFNFSSPSN